MSTDDTPQPPPDLHDALDELRQTMADASSLAGIMAELRRTADKFLGPLGDEWRKLRRQLDQIVPLLPIVTAAVLVTGCVNPIPIVQHFAKPAMTFREPPAWRCEEKRTLPTKAGLESCDVCRNISATGQGVTVNQTAYTVKPGQHVYLCPTTAMVEATE